jgi:flagellar basal-body rod protein FlgG
MNRALYAAANGMALQQQNLELIAANLSNADVAGFKGAERSAFGTRTIFTQGKLERGTGPFDLAIDGPGFFCVENDRGERAYTRDGEFSRAPDGTLRSTEGWRLQSVRIPSDAISATVGEDGTVTATFANGKRVCGHIRLTEFPAPDLLRSAGGTMFFATRASGKPHEITPGSTSGPSIRFGMLEQSNVTIVEAMMEILAAQRAYEANAKGVQAADEMMRIADNLQR